MSVTAPGAGDATVIRPTVVEVSLARLTENLRAIETVVAPAAVMQIVAAARDLGVSARVHLKIDTGMERIGVHYYNAHGLLEQAAECRHTVVEGIYSHFANADAADLASARLQLARFLDVLQWYDKH